MNKKSSIIIAISIVVIFAAIFIFLRSVFKEDAETETIYCGENKTLPVKVFKNPTKAFPIFAQDLNSNIKLNIDLVDSITIAGDVELNRKVIELRDRLNQESSRMEMIMKSNFLAYNSRPCDTAISKDYFDLLKLMANKNSELERLRAQLSQPVSKGGNDPATLKPISDTLKIREALDKFYGSYSFQE